MDEALKERRHAIIRASLPLIAQEGWTHAALLKGAEKAGYNEAILSLCFDDKIGQAIAHYSAMLDEEMIKSVEALPLEMLKIRERIGACVLARLAVMDIHKDVARRTARYLALPPHAALASTLVYKTVSAMWYAAGDQAADFSFYTKRATLAAVYASTVFYWLRDGSENYVKTRRFLERRISEALMIPKIKQRIRTFFGR